MLPRIWAEDEATMTPTELRMQSRVYRRAAAAEPTLEIKHRLANHALALELLAESIERENAA
jgi:hypothetical protein